MWEGIWVPCSKYRRRCDRNQEDVIFLVTQTPVAETNCEYCFEGSLAYVQIWGWWGGRASHLSPCSQPRTTVLTSFMSVLRHPQCSCLGPAASDASALFLPLNAPPEPGPGPGVPPKGRVFSLFSNLPMYLLVLLNPLTWKRHSVI